MKKESVKKIATAAWDAAGIKTLNTTMGMAMKKFSKSLYKNYGVKEEQMSNLSNIISEFIGYMVTQKIHNKSIETSHISSLINNDIVPAVASIASNNPKGEDIVNSISGFVGGIADNAALGTLLSQFAGNDVTEQIQLAVNSIAALNNPAATESSLQVIEHEDAETEEIIEAEDMNDEVADEEINEDVLNIPIVKEEMTDEEDEQFVNDVIGAMKMDFSSPEAAKDSFDKFVKVAGEVAKFSELQETKRTQIRADAEVAIKKVEAMRDVLKQYLEKSFDERSTIFMKQFEVVDKALATGDNAMLSMGLTAINELAASSPFKALADINSVQQMLTDDSELDI